MFRKLVLLAAAALLCAGTAAVADDEKKPDDPKPADKKPDPAKGKGKFDRAKLFARIDADGDGKLTREEFKKFGEMIRDRLQDKGKGGKLPVGFGEKLFDRLDANKDGVISKEEFEKFHPRGGLAGKRNKKD